MELQAEAQVETESMSLTSRLGLSQQLLDLLVTDRSGLGRRWLVLIESFSQISYSVEALQGGIHVAGVAQVLDSGWWNFHLPASLHQQATYGT